MASDEKKTKSPNHANNFFPPFHEAEKCGIFGYANYIIDFEDVHFVYDNEEFDSL